MYRVVLGQRLVLASASPRRREMLARLGLSFTIAPAQVDEALEPGETAEQAAQRLAGIKAVAVAAARPGQAVLAADTLVALDDMIMGKPADQKEAAAMLGRLAGREHRVVTGFCLVQGPRRETGLAVSRVRFRALRRAEIAAYVASGEPMGKAGAYAVQGLGAALVAEVAGSYTNVVGLPLAACLELMMAWGLVEPLPAGNGAPTATPAPGKETLH